MARPPAIETETGLWLALDISSLNLTDDQLLRLFSDNEEYQFELSAEGELIVMSPANHKASFQNTKIIARLFTWAEQDGRGITFDSNTLFALPNGAKRGPDAAWISKTHWNRLSEDEKERFSNIVPEFVVELRSKSNRLRNLKTKMDEYMANGVKMAWLLDTIGNSATIYRADQPPVEIQRPTILAGDPILPGFTFDFRELLVD